MRYVTESFFIFHLAFFIWSLYALRSQSSQGNSQQETHAATKSVDTDAATDGSRYTDAVVQ